MGFESCRNCSLFEQDNLESLNRIAEAINERLALDAEVYTAIFERARHIYTEDQEYFGQAYADAHNQTPRRQAEAVAYGSLALLWSTSLAKAEAGVNGIDCSDTMDVCPRRIAAFSAVVHLHNEDVLGTQSTDE